MNTEPEPVPPPPLQSSPQPFSSSPLVTPGLIVSSLPPSRLAELAHSFNVPLASLVTQSPSSAVPRMLAMLKDSELRKIAREVGVPDDGQFIDLFRRLSQVCVNPQKPGPHQ